MLVLEVTGADKTFTFWENVVVNGSTVRDSFFILTMSAAPLSNQNQSEQFGQIPSEKKKPW